MRLSKLGYYADFFICAALIVFLAGLVLLQLSWTKFALWIVFSALGLALWTLVEYAVHRWLYHSVPYFKDVHDAHHAEPNAHIGAPPVVCVALIFAIFFAPFANTHFTAACGLTTGILIGYMAYMLMHHAAHAWSPKPGTWLHGARRHHALHHFRAEECNFGITTAFWDHVFGTALEKGPKAFAPSSQDG